MVVLEKEIVYGLEILSRLLIYFLSRILFKRRSRSVFC